MCNAQHSAWRRSCEALGRAITRDAAASSAPDSACPDAPSAMFMYPLPLSVGTSSDSSNETARNPSRNSLHETVPTSQARPTHLLDRKPSASNSMLSSLPGLTGDKFRMAVQRPFRRRHGGIMADHFGVLSEDPRASSAGRSSSSASTNTFISEWETSTAGAIQTIHASRLSRPQARASSAPDK